MKTQWVVAATVLCIAASAISATAHGRGRGGPGFHRTSLTELLGLSQEQQTQWQELKTSLMEQEQALHEEYQAGFEALLTPEQLAQLEEISTSPFGHGRHRRISLAEELELTAEQLAQLEALKTDFMERKQALHEEYQAGFEALLTPEQLARLEEIKASSPFCHNKAGEAQGEETGDTGTQTSEATLQSAPALPSLVTAVQEQAADTALQVAPLFASPATAVEQSTWGQIKNSLGDW